MQIRSKINHMHRLWEGSWADDALQENKQDEIYADVNRIKSVTYHSENFSIEAPHIVDPSPQRTPFLFQAGTSPAGISFAATHAEGILVSGLSPHILAPRIKALRTTAAEQGRDPQSIKVFAVLTPVVGTTDEDAQAKYDKALEYASSEGGLTFISANLGIDLSQFDPDAELTTSDVQLDSRVHSFVSNLEYHGTDVPTWTPRNIGKAIAIGGNGPVPVGSPATVADFMENWMAVADVDGFNIGYVTTPGTFEDVVDLLVPELRRRGIYAPVGESGTMRERFLGQSRVRSDHVANKYKFE
jgi:alkanesulfonate monooxygenase SsuD/methylene tetrahydromethanopterin reductase-like flavin-dependent oxidoreductase (luciferase family)